MKPRIRFRLSWQFSLSTLLLTVALVAMLCGWLVDRHRQSERLEEMEEEAKQASLLIENLSLASFVNTLYSRIERSSPEEIERDKRTQLLTNLFTLQQTEEFESYPLRGKSLMHADHSLAMLGCDTVEQVRQIVRNAGFVRRFEAPFLDPNDPSYPDLEDFIQRAFARRRSQPHYPAQIWRQAIHDADAARLATAFSSAVQKQSDEDDWNQRLKSYQEDLAAQLGDFEVSDLTFMSTTSFDGTGEVVVFHQDKEIRTLTIIKEGDHWKIDKP